MSTPLQGIKVLDFTGVQSGPSCTQMLAWFGADVIKIERPGVGDVTRHQLRDIPDIDALYFTMLNSNKRSIELNTKTAEGKEVMEKLIREADILVENFHPGAIDHMGFTWEHIQEINPRLIFGSIKGFDECSPYVNVKAYENVAQAAGWRGIHYGFLGRSAAGKRCSVRRQQHRNAFADRFTCCFAASRKNGAWATSHHVNAGCRIEPLPREITRPAASR